MKINGIIAEYNPFHNGHKYQLESSRALTGADYTIVAISGNFMQRGTPALLNKYARAEMALLNGADLVLEIPAFYACGSAEFYARGAVALLDKLGVVNCLCFGSEHGDVNAFYEIARILSEEPERYREFLSEKLCQGLSFPAARAQAICEYISQSTNCCKSTSCSNPPHCSKSTDFSKVIVPSNTKTANNTETASDYRAILSSPNNILGIEYIKALIERQSSIQPVTVKRLGADYHEKRIEAVHSSATAIRHAIFTEQDLEVLNTQMPESACQVLRRHLSCYKPLQENDLSQLLLYKLLSEEKDGYQQYMDVTPDLSDKIKKHLYRFTDFHTFCDLLKSKDNTHTRLSRSLLHILLNITADEVNRYKALDYVPYARVLGLRKSASPLLSAIKQNTSIPLISKLADADRVLEGTALEMLYRDIQISQIYNGIEAMKSGCSIRNEYSTPIIVL